MNTLIKIHYCHKILYAVTTGTHINRTRPNKCIDIILDKNYNKIVPKSINNHPEFNINYLKVYVINYNNYYANQFKKILEVKK